MIDSRLFLIELITFDLLTFGLITSDLLTFGLTTLDLITLSLFFYANMNYQRSNHENIV